MIQPRATCLLIGETGVGKSQFGNRYLQQDVFATGGGAAAVTRSTRAHSANLAGQTRWVIDTEGHADGTSLSADQIQDIAGFLQRSELGMNGICIVLNVSSYRFSQGPRDVVQWSYNSFGTPEFLGHVSLLFTHCSDTIPESSRVTKRTEFRQSVEDFLQVVSGEARVPQIPVFFIDSLARGSAETERNLMQFHEWLVHRTPLPTRNVRAVPLRETIETEDARKVLVGYRYEGAPSDQSRFAIYEDRDRYKLTPHNGDPVRYSEWRVLRHWEEAAGHQTIVTMSKTHETEHKSVDHHGRHSMFGFSSRNHTHYSIYRRRWTEQWTVTTDFDRNVTATQPSQVGQTAEWQVNAGREHGWTKAYTRVIS
jgi:hypothetical protein